MTAARRIGVDFDNTIVCYDEVFQALAVERRVVPAEAARHKHAVRAHLRAIGREDLWTALQGEVYGAAMTRARPFRGVVEFFTACVRAAVGVCIISHRSKQPYAGPPFDLHAAAQHWLAAAGFFDPQRVGLSPEQVFFEETPPQKLQRLREQGCTHFIDDLSEFLANPDFPAGVTRIHFDPQDSGATPPGCLRASSWEAIHRMLLASGSAAA